MNVNVETVSLLRWAGLESISGDILLPIAIWLPKSRLFNQLRGVGV